MNILVTGGAGYVGSACLRYMLARGHNAVAFDNLVQGHAAAVPGGKTGGRLIVGDIADTEALVAALRKVNADAVMHFAAATYVGESVENPEYHYRNNIGGTLSLLNAMRKAGVKRMLFSSTCATYGMTPKVPMSEDSPQEPFSPYARTKLAVEWMIRDFAHAYGLGFTLLRYFNAAGASADGDLGEDHDPETHLIPLVLQVALGQREHITVFGDQHPTPDGTCIRDYIHVDDLASAHISALERLGPGVEFKCNLGTGRGTSVNEVIEACRAITGHPIPAVVAGPRAGDPPSLVADSSLARRELGWLPKFTSIAPIVQSAWKWHQSHPRGFDD